MDLQVKEFPENEQIGSQSVLKVGNEAVKRINTKRMNQPVIKNKNKFMCQCSGSESRNLRKQPKKRNVKTPRRIIRFVCVSANIA